MWEEQSGTFRLAVWEQELGVREKNSHKAVGTLEQRLQSKR